MRTPGPFGLILRAAGVCAAVLAVSATAVTAYAITSVTASLDEAAVDIGGTTPPAPPPFLGAFEGSFNLLVVGTDNDANQGEEFGERDATLNDVTILLHVAPDHRSAVVVSFPRDMIIAHPECEDSETGEVFDAMSAQPLNTAYGRGGLACVVSTVTSLTGAPIDYAAATSFIGVIEMTNAVGGVEVCLTEAIFDEDSGVDLPAGESLVSGQSALAFLRNRHGVGNGSDLSRIGSQQQYLSSLLRTIRADSTLTDPGKLYGLARAAAGNVIPSLSLKSIDSMVSLALTLKDVELDRVIFVQYPVTAYALDTNKVAPVESVADELFARILNDEPFTLPDDASSPGSSVVAEPEAPLPQPTETTAMPEAVVPTESAPAIEGLHGQTAAQQTCASGFSG